MEPFPPTAPQPAAPARLGTYSQRSQALRLRIVGRSFHLEFSGCKHSREDHSCEIQRHRYPEHTVRLQAVPSQERLVRTAIVPFPPILCLVAKPGAFSPFASCTPSPL